jgi:cytidylate kinase
MAIVIISSVDEGVRRELADALAKKLDCPSLSREELVDQAIDSGIPVGRLEMAVLKQSVPKERLARHKAQYLAIVTGVLCETSRQHKNLVYHGRAGNMLLNGVSHVLRVRVVPNAERRLARVMERLNLSRPKALEYISRLDEDVANWVRFAHGADMNDPQLYDLTLNLEQVGLASACAIVCEMAQLPEFQMTPASCRFTGDLCLAARARDRLGRDERTARSDLTVSAREGLVTVTYMPAQSEVADAIPTILEGLEGASQLVSTMAVSNVMWVAESFDPGSRTYDEITDLARRWGAAIELGRHRRGRDGSVATASLRAQDERRDGRHRGGRPRANGPARLRSRPHLGSPDWRRSVRRQPNTRRRRRPGGCDPARRAELLAGGRRRRVRRSRRLVADPPHAGAVRLDS